MDLSSSLVNLFASLLDLFPYLSSAIAVPTGLVHTSRRKVILQDCLSVLNQAEEACWTVLSLTARNGSVTHFREAAMSLTSILAFQINLGKNIKSTPYVVSALLGEVHPLFQCILIYRHFG